MMIYPTSILLGESPSGLTCFDDVGNTWRRVVQREQRKLYGTRAPQRRRRKRLAKKIAARGGMLHYRGLVQSFYRAWPALRWLKAT